MIKKVSVTNPAGETIEFELGRPAQSGFSIRGIDGLNPVKATINTTEIMGLSGSVFNSARTSKRNIIFQLGFESGTTIEQSRLDSYRYFPVEKPVLITVETDSRTGNILGYVESNEIDIFSKDEQATISIICPDPNFASGEVENTIFAGIVPLFEFPFENPSTTESLIEFGMVINNDTNNISYVGDADTGIIIHVHAIGPVSDLEIFNTFTDEWLAVDSARLIEYTGSDITTEDEIFISSVSGNKYIYLLRDGVFTNIINCLDKDSDWFKLSTGDNVFVFNASSGKNNIQFDISYRILYKGL